MQGIALKQPFHRTYHLDFLKKCLDHRSLQAGKNAQRPRLFRYYVSQASTQPAVLLIDLACCQSSSSTPNDAPESLQPASSSSFQPCRPKVDSQGHFLSTLNPFHILPSDYHDVSAQMSRQPGHPYATLSTRQPLHIDLSDRHTRITDHVSFPSYANGPTGGPIPFPAGTRGFWYYHQPPKASAIAGALRFRVVDNVGHPPDVSRWSEGVDLRCPDGKVWEKPLLAIVKSRPQLSALQTLLLKDGLISPEVVGRCEEILEWRKTLRPNILLSYLDKVFWTPFSSFDRGQFAVVGRTAQRYVKIAPFFKDMRGPKTRAPYTGELHFYPPSHHTRV